MTGALREAFLKRLTEGSETKDRRRRGYSQALFLGPDAGAFAGKAVWSETTLDMVMAAFDAAVRDLRND